jgi:hypothetical protein
MCEVNFGCNAQKRRARETPAPETPRRTSSLPASPGRKSPRKRAPSMVGPQAGSVAAGSKLAPQARNDVRAPKKRPVPANGGTRGPKGGRAVVSKMTLQSLNSARETCRNLPSRNKMTQTAFLRSPLSGDLVNGTRAEQGGFGKMLERFDRGTLKPSNKKRGRDRKFEDIELKLIEHLDLRAKSHLRDKCGVSWITLTNKSTQFADLLGCDKDKFKASPGWMQDTLLQENWCQPSWRGRRRVKRGAC